MNNSFQTFTEITENLKSPEKRQLRETKKGHCEYHICERGVVATLSSITFTCTTYLILSYMSPTTPPPPVMFLLRNSETTQAIKLKLSHFKNSSLRHIFHVMAVPHILSCYHGNQIYKGTSQYLPPNKRGILQ